MKIHKNLQLLVFIFCPVWNIRPKYQVAEPGCPVKEPASALPIMLLVSSPTFLTVTSQYHLPDDIPIVELTPLLPPLAVTSRFPLESVALEPLSRGFKVA